MRVVLKITEHNYEYIVIRENGPLFSFKGNNIILTESNYRLNDNELISYNDDKYLLLSEEVSVYKKPSKLTIGNHFCDISLNITPVAIIDQQIYANNNEIYINGIKIQDDIVNFNYGDEILLNNIVLYILKDKVIINKNVYITVELEEEENKQELPPQFPIYATSPRVFFPDLEDEIEIKAPPKKERMPMTSILRTIIPSIVTITGMIIISIFFKRSPIFMLVGAATAITVTIFSVVHFFKTKRDVKDKEQERQRVYRQYLKKIRKQIFQIINEKLATARDKFPTPNQLASMVDEFNHRIYEKSYLDDDFLEVSIGEISAPLIDIKVNIDELSLETDELIDQIKAIKELNEQGHLISYPLSLNKQNLGIINHNVYNHNLLLYIILQIVLFHSYNDVALIYFGNRDLSSLRTLRHFYVPNYNINSYVDNMSDAELVAEAVYQILKERSLQAHDKMFTSPYLVIIVEDESLIKETKLYEYVTQINNDLNYSLLYTCHSYNMIPSKINNIIKFENNNEYKLLIENNLKKALTVYVSEVNIDIDEFSRNLSVLEHKHVEKAAIPNYVDLLSLLGVESVEALDILQRWKNACVYESMATPIGLRGPNEIVELDVHENAHGPHGLIAGTTGSGKSEFIQTYILSLAINFSPEDVGFLLIDYKGGGMAEQFSNLPHLLGTITNLNTDEINRVLVSVNAEILRREHIFNQSGVNNINAYTKLFKKGKVKEPLPHLFIISDEFAELKKDQPDFIKKLVSIARVGRTLGIHLILATQKPAGVVDDQIWSNARFKVALKVQSESDSKEIIKTADAASIKQSGRAYLQVGNNEIYELFQSAYSGATDIKPIGEISKFDATIYKVNELGQMQLYYKDKETNNPEDRTQLESIIAEVEKINKDSNYQVKKPWVLPLEKEILAPFDIEDVKQATELDMEVELGEIDIPKKQTRDTYTLNVDDNILLCGSSKSGKTFALSNIILELARKNNPELLNWYIIDFGNAALNILRDLPHTTDYVRDDETEKLNKFFEIIRNEIANRKKLFAKTNAQNIEMYNDKCWDNPLNKILIFVDNFDLVRDMNMIYVDYFKRISRDGNGVGIHIIATINKSTAIGYQMLNNFKYRICLFNNDKSEIGNLLGRSDLNIADDIPGRCIVQTDELTLMQIYKPFDTSSQMELVQQVEKLISTIQKLYPGYQKHQIPTLPNELYYSDMQDYGYYQELHNDIVGLEAKSVTKISANIVDSIFLILGSNRSGKTNLLEVLLNQCSGKVYVCDDQLQTLIQYRNYNEFTYVENYANFLDEIELEYGRRKQAITKMIEDGEKINVRSCIQSMPEIHVFIEDADNFVKEINKFDYGYQIIENAMKYGIKFIVTASAQKLQGIDQLTKLIKNTSSGVVLGDITKFSTINIFPINNRKFPIGRGILFVDGIGYDIAIPIFDY